MIHQFMESIEKDMRDNDNIKRYIEESKPIPSPKKTKYMVITTNSNSLIDS